MKRNCSIIYLLTVVFILLPNNGCKEQAKVERKLKTVPTEAQGLMIGVSDPNKPAPKIEFDKVVLDFGKVGPGTKSTGELRFTNTGKGILKITEVEQCCGVVTTLEKNEYTPGETGVIKVIYSATTQIGLFKRQLVVSSNDNTNPSAELTIKAEIIPKIACKPNRLKLFLDEENAGCPELTVNSIDNQPFAITGIRSTADCITADYDPAIKATEFVLDLKVDMENIQKNPRGYIEFILTHPEGNIASVPFNVVPKYTLDPQMLIFFNAEQQKPILKTIKVLNNYTEDFEIASTTSKDNTIKVIKNSKVEKGYRLDIEITPPAKEDKIRFSDVFYINIKGGEKLAVTCTGYYARG